MSKMKGLAVLTILALVLTMGGLVFAAPGSGGGGSSQVNIIATKYFDENGNGDKDQTGAIEYWMAGFEFELYEYKGTETPEYYPSDPDDWQKVGVTVTSASPNGQATFGMQPHGWHRMVELPHPGYECTNINGYLFPDGSYEYIWLTTNEVQSDIWFGNQEVEPPPPPELPEITVTKTANPTEVPETGGYVTFTITVENTGPVAVTLTSAIDTVFGALALSNFDKTYLEPSDVATYSFSEWLVGVPGIPHVNVVTVIAEDELGQSCQASDDATVNFTDDPDWHDETAWAAGLPYPGSNWATYTPYVADTYVTLYAGQYMEAGTVYFSAVDEGKVTLTITLNEGWRFAPVPDNVKIQDYAVAPTKAPVPGDFDWKVTATESPFVVEVPLNNFYGIHLDVQYCD